MGLEDRDLLLNKDLRIICGVPIDGNNLEDGWIRIGGGNRHNGFSDTHFYQTSTSFMQAVPTLVRNALLEIEDPSNYYVIYLFIDEGGVGRSYREPVSNFMNIQ